MYVCIVRTVRPAHCYTIWTTNRSYRTDPPPTARRYKGATTMGSNPTMELFLEPPRLQPSLSTNPLHTPTLLAQDTFQRHKQRTPALTRSFNSQRQQPLWWWLEGVRHAELVYWKTPLLAWVSSVPSFFSPSGSCSVLH